MSKLRVLTYLKFQEDEGKNRRVKTVLSIPKILTIVPTLNKKKEQNLQKSLHLLPDPDEIPESDEEDSKQDDALEGLGDSDGSSVDGEGEDEENIMH
jgi:hypothetical protein